MTVEQELTDVALRDAVLLHQLNGRLQLVAQVILCALGHAAVIGALFLKGVELAIHTTACSLDSVDHALEVNLLINPVVEELVAQLQWLWIVRRIPNTIHWLIEDALAAVLDCFLALARNRIRVRNRNLHHVDSSLFTVCSTVADGGLDLGV